MKKDVSIIFVNYKTKDLTIDAIKSVIEKTTGLDYEIFVVDNNSQNGSIEAIEQEFPNINIIKNFTNSGFGSANNLGIKKAIGKYVLCLNTDTLLINNAIKILYDYMEKPENKNIAVCGGALFNANNENGYCGGHLPNIQNIIMKIGLRNILKKMYKKYTNALKVSDLTPPYDIGYIIGANMFIRKNVLDEVGLFDENIFMYFEETDLCKRIKNKGYEIRIVPDAKIIHFEGQSTSNTLLKRIWFKTSEFYYFKKHHPIKYIFVKLIYFVLYFIDGYLLKNNDSKELLKEVLNQ